MARAHWVEGRVVLPAGTPEDEVCIVAAHGRAFSDGTIHRSRVGADGRFRVAFSPGAKAGWIGVEGRYLHTPARARWLRRSAAEEVTLTPELGGVVFGRLSTQPGVQTRPPDGDVELLRAHSSCATSWSKDRQAALGSNGEFVFERVPAGQRRLAYRGAAWLARSPPFELAPGETKRVDLVLEAGVVLGGRVQDERGRGIVGARIVAQGSGIAASSEKDGSFRLPALEAGERTLLVSCSGFVPSKRPLGTFVAGARRTNLALVLDRGETIAGRVLLPDGRTTEVGMRATPEEPRGPGQVSLAFRSASDGTFRVRGLLPGSYRLEARKGIGREKITASCEHVKAGTTDLVLQLAPRSSIGLESMAHPIEVDRQPSRRETPRPHYARSAPPTR
jgi:hypothetical protein